jgi:hypothetical protein
MKPFVLFALFTLAAAPAALAQAPKAATVKTKVKPAGQPSVKTKATRSTDEDLAPVSAPAEVVDAKTNALTANMKTNLGLSPQQTEKVRVINRRGIEMVESAHLRYRTTPAKLAGIVDVAGRSRLEALKDVLTPQQFAKYQRRREEKMGVPNLQGAQGNKAPGLGGGNPDE